MTSKQHTRKHNKEFRKLYDASGLKKLEIANMLGVSLDTVIAWLKPETSKSSNACPAWAVEMFKMKQTQGKYQPS